MRGTITAYIEAMTAIAYQPMPIAMPTAAANQMAAAVVKLRMVLFSVLRIMPAEKANAGDDLRGNADWTIGICDRRDEREQARTGHDETMALMPAGLLRSSRSTKRV